MTESEKKRQLDERGQLLTECQRMLDTAKAAGRGLTTEEDVKYNELFDRAAAIKKEVERRSALDDELRDIEELEGQPTPTGSSQRGGQPDPEEEYRSAMMDYLRCTTRSQAQNVEQRATLQASNDAGGGYALGRRLMADILTDLDNRTFMRQICDVQRLENAGSLGVVIEDTRPSDAEWTPEVGETTVDTATSLGLREFKPNLLSKEIKVSQRLVRMLPNFPAYLLRRMAYAMAVPMESAYMTGDGVNKPLGIFTASANGIPTTYDVSTENTTTAITANGLKNLIWSLPAQHRNSPNFRWVAHRDFYKQASKLTDGEGQYLWNNGLATAEGPTLLGYQYEESEYAPNTFTASQYVAVVGNFDYYMIADALTMTVQNLLELYARTNQIGYIARIETDGAPTLAQAFRRLQLAAG